MMIRPKVIFGLLSVAVAAVLFRPLFVHAQQTCPCSIWTLTTTPGALDNEAGTAELGVKFTSDTSGFITAVRFYKYVQNTGAHVGNLWTSTGTLLGTVTYTGESASGWQQATFSTPIAITAGTTYIASYHTNSGFPAVTPAGFTTAVDNAPLHAVSSSSSGGNGVFAYSATSTFPNQTFNASNYWVDVVFTTTTTDTTPPTVVSTTPASAATGVSTSAAVTATFSEALAPATVTTSTVLLKDPSNATVAATVGFNATSLTATLTPTAPLAVSTTYTATIKGGAAGVTDAAGNPLASDFTWSFTTAAPNVCPCSIWSATATPGPLDNEAGTAELGVKFKSDSSGFITGLRFYKYAQNTGTHLGNLWSSTGTLLATVTFTGETASGWQQMNFATPVAISANTTYVASYHTNSGFPAATSPGFTTPVDNAPLHALSDSAGGGNGVFLYSATSGFPNQTFNATNYWVDVVFATGDVTPPTVTGTTPAPGAAGVAPTTTVTATFSEAMNVSTINTSTIVLKDAGNNTVAATVTYNNGTFTATLTPSAPLASGATYTATVKSGSGGVTDAASNPLVSDYTWAFTTIADTTPPTVIAVSPSNGATGVATTATVTSTFSEALNASTVSASTVLLKAGATSVAATVVYNSSTFTATLLPTSQLANLTVYTATIKGGASGVKDLAGNALAADFSWSFTTVPDTTPPTITGFTPASNATNVAVSAAPTATFSEALAVSSIGPSTVSLKDSNGTQIAAAVSYNAATFTATLTPNAALSYSTKYTVTILGGAGGVTDVAGNPLASTFAWSFTTVAPPYTCPCSVWTTSTTPGAMDSQTGAVELGMKFTADINGWVTGVRYYKYSQNIGTHVGNLWASDGTLLASVTFTGESSSGWQQATFGSPVPVTANATYIISYHTNTGLYAATTNGFSSAVDNAPLHALPSGSSGGNGVYSPGSTSTFPNQTFSATNYWVDVVFSLDVTPPTVTSTSPASGATGVALTASMSATFSESMTASTINSSTVLLSTGSTSLPATVAFDGGTSTMTLTPTSPLTYLTLYTVTIKGGSAGVKDSASTPMASDYTWSFTSVTDTTPPVITATVPVAGATNISPNAPLSVTFNKAMNVASVNTGITLRDATNTLVPATVTYNPATFTGILTPTAWLAKGTTYTVTVLGGASGVKDTYGNAPPSNVSWNFTTVGTGCPCSIWTLSTPGGPMANDPGVGEIGVKFRSDTAGFISALRYYKYAANSGTHVGNLWSSTGTLLATATFSNETASGWQQVTFSSPVAISANTTYVASYHTNSGFYAATTNGLTTAVDNPPLHALSSGSSGGNGVFAPGSASAFPNQTWNASNYWVDVVFTTSGADTTPPWVTGTSPANNTLGVATSTVVTATFSEPIDTTTISASTFELRDASNNVVASTISYNSSTWTATLTPTAALASGATYTVRVKTGVRDVAGNGLLTTYTSSFTTTPAVVTPTQGSGGPILVVTSTSNQFTQYYPEILRAEGFTEFSVIDIGSVTASVLANYDVVVLGQQTLTTTQANRFVTWVQGGGNLIAMRPDSKLATLLGLTSQSATLSNTYMAIDTTQAPGTGLVSATMQFHGTADEYVSAGARAVATLYSDATHATAFPAVTLFTSGLGQAAAFTYDLAQSIVYTRQGNPAWAGTERDGQAPIRPDDMYYGAKSGDVQPDWIDLTKVAIPQADEQQRLLANLILLMNSTKRPLPRFWYLPQGRKAAVVMTGDDHASGGQPSRFNGYLSQSPANCQVDNWDCVRASTFMYPTTPVTNTQVAAWVAQGFEVGVHVTMDPTTQYGCGVDYTVATLTNAYTTQLSQFKSTFPAAGTSTTHRMHCLMWSDWSSQPTTELSNSIRLDASYYYWPPTWVNDTPGMFTGSGMPMRYATINGSPIDVYQSTTQMTDESGQTYPKTINTLLDNALGATAYYGVFTANIHTDNVSSQPIANAIVASAQARGVAVVSAKQMLNWLDGRNNSVVTGLGWSGSVLTFGVVAASNTNGLQVMVPTQWSTHTLVGITQAGAPVSYTTQTIKGVSYAFITVTAGQYTVTYTP